MQQAWRRRTQKKCPRSGWARESLTPSRGLRAPFQKGVTRGRFSSLSFDLSPGLLSNPVGAQVECPQGLEGASTQLLLV
jgi:hypothetical protein